ncbi:hypothetical protein E2C01_057961 [Portunus trituberculatus]|uniref:Uncharacterized protein n=1 Tax=Portunus trituberculatus TaxID=210409 RepID=A0A5B7H4S0_PORTR|nr:hypothetical protein [Portunus trituberculatus]
MFTQPGKLASLGCERERCGAAAEEGREDEGIWEQSHVEEEEEMVVVVLVMVIAVVVVVASVFLTSRTLVGRGREAEGERWEVKDFQKAL